MSPKTGKYVSGKFYSSVKYKANKRGIDFADDLTIEFLDELLEQQEFKCFYSGLPIDAKTRNGITASLDRRDSNRGYERDNVQFTCIKVNFMKHVISDAEFIELVGQIYNNIVEKTKKVEDVYKEWTAFK